MSTQNLWAKLAPLNPDKELVNINTEEVKIENNFRISQRSTGETWITNLSPLYLKVGESWLGTNQEKQLFGGEMLAFCQDKQEKSLNYDYVFCLMGLQLKNELKRNREDESSVELSNEKPLEKLIKVDNSIQEIDITCSICLGVFVRCATLGPCGHNLCGHCLLNHLKNSSLCPLCKKQIVSVIKNSALCNIIETAVKNSPNLQRSSNEGIIPLQKDLEGNVNINGKEIFIGSVINWKKEGQGTMVYQGGDIHQGVWKNDIREGEGVLIVKNGTFVKGLWLRDCLQPHVEIKYATGDTYKGETKLTTLGGIQRHGRGIIKCINGEMYEGDFKENYPEGKGKYFYKNGTEYEGDFLKGERHGLGAFKFPNGTVYKGEWKGNKREGNGVQTYPNGDRYEGTWINNISGIGKYFWPDGREYEGDFTGYRRDGHGTMKFPNGDIFKGEWQEDKRNGKGVFILKDGREIEGDWINDALHPMAKMEYPNGNRYEGEIQTQTCQKHGKGVLFFNTRGQYDGHWNQDQQIGAGKYTLEFLDRKYEEFWDGGNVPNSILTLANGTKYKAAWKKIKKLDKKISQIEKE